MVGELNGSLPKPIQINSGNLRNENDVDPALTNRSIFICRCFPPRCFPTKVIMIPRYKPPGSMLMQKLPEIRSWPLHASTCQVSADCFCLQPEGTLPMHNTKPQPWLLVTPLSKKWITSELRNPIISTNNPIEVKQQGCL